MNGEKPYEFVGFPSKRPDRKSGVGQDQIQRDLLSGTLELTMETLTPVHVGSGYTDFVKAGNQEYLAALQASKRVRDNATVRRRYLIPGSSIKGAVRSIVEAITASCVRIVQNKYRSYLPNGYAGCSKVDSLCLACRLFGAQDYQGHVSIEDAVAPPGSLVLIGTPLLWTPARGTRGLPPRYLDSDDRASGRKFYAHAKPAQGPDPRTCIKTGTQLPLRIHFINLSEAELGVLLTALGLHPQYRFPLKLGGGKPVGLGSVKLTLNALRLLHGDQAIQQTGRLAQATVLEGNPLEQRVKQYTKNASELLDSEALQALANVLAEEGLNNPAPADPY
ncbi:MAG: RAMP superfamily CRISPR-associated protein [bacterium]|nr:RAMP superfamily CRISPR-associated protein [bacterium]